MSGNPPLSYIYTASLIAGVPAILARSDGVYIPCDLDNMDYQAFLAAISAGNTAPEGWTGPTNPAPPTEETTTPPASGSA